MVTGNMKAYVMNLESRPDRLAEFRTNQFPFEVERYNAIKTDPGWVGCTASQIDILSTNKQYPFAIFEDDCVLLQPWDKIEEIMKQLPEDWDALYLGATLMAPVERYSENLCRLTNGLCAHAIIYNSERLVKYILGTYEYFFANSSTRNTLDVFYAADVQNKFNIFITNPLCATQRPGFSDIEQMNVDYIQIINHFKDYVS